jgi:ABC-type Fe2+-enterobactin transport system substrate-binding protein
MDDALLEAFRAAAYHVNLDTVSWATIRVDLPLPTDLVTLVGTRPWAFITAWNPQARRRQPAENLAAQSDLLAALQERPDTLVRPAIGVGSSGWIEPSLFAVGPDIALLDQLARAHGQLAYVHGEAGSPALLRVLG